MSLIMTIHIIATTIAYGMAAGYSLAHRFWVGTLVGVLAIVHAWLLVFFGISPGTIIAQQPLTVTFAWFIVRAAQSSELLADIINTGEIPERVAQ